MKKRRENEIKMKVLMINGSPNKEGCTYTALSEVASVLEKEGIETGSKDYEFSKSFTITEDDLKEFIVPKIKYMLTDFSKQLFEHFENM